MGVIAVEIMPISSRITHPMPGKQEMCADIHAILKYHGWDKFVLVSHSYGTAISTHLLKSSLLSSQIESVVLIDPITFLLHLPDVAYNFTRRQPKKANELQLHYFGSMDMGVSHALARCFFWSENVLWKEELGDRNVTVSLAGRDLIVNTEAAGTYLATKESKPSRALFANNELADQFSRETLNEHDASDQDPCTNGMVTGRKHDQHGEDSGNDGSKNWKQRPWVGSGLDILWFPTLDHAQVFDKAKTRSNLIHAIKSYSSRSSRPMRF